MKTSDRPRHLVSALLVMIFLVSASCSAGAELPTVYVGEHPFRLEIAATPEERATGLMFREELDPDQGMLFVFPESAPRSFWMKNTPLPLSIAYIAADGTILEIYDMEPHSLEPVRSRFPAKYALEVNQGRFRELGIDRGTVIDLTKVPAASR